MKILLPVDGSEYSFSTLDWAAETFDRATARYYVLFVVALIPSMVGLDAAKAIEYDLDYAADVLSRCKAQLENRGCTVERTEAVSGDPAEQICAYADAINADQVVIGSHGKTGLGKLILGSVSTKVLERCQRPVTIHKEYLAHA
jgi:nucleotide-binding universal stress UspA family protein